MPQERVIGSYLLRLTEEHGRKRIVLQNLRQGGQLEFETWVSAWAFLDRVLHEEGSADPGSPDPYA